MTLFPEPTESLLLIVDMTAMSGAIFVDFIRKLRPRLVLDLRPVPTFDLESFDRRRAFDLFEQTHVTYRDVTARIHISSPSRDAAFNAGDVAAHLRSFVSAPRGTPLGPLAILMEDQREAEFAARHFQSTLEPRPKGGWQLELLPRAGVSLVK